jgi:flagellar assembly factor FliW
VAEPARQTVAETVAIRSKRFGEYEVPADRVIAFRDGLIGFPQAQRFVLLEPSRSGSPFRYLLCVDLPELGFVVCDATVLSPGYLQHIPLLPDWKREDVAVLAIVTVPAEPRAMTANLMAPLVIDSRSAAGRQVVLDTGCHPLRFPIFPPDLPPSPSV